MVDDSIFQYLFVKDYICFVFIVIKAMDLWWLVQSHVEIVPHVTQVA